MSSPRRPSRMATMTSERIARWRCGSAVSQKRVTTFIVAPLSVVRRTCGAGSLSTPSTPRAASRATRSMVVKSASLTTVNGASRRWALCAEMLITAEVTICELGRMTRRPSKVSSTVPRQPTLTTVPSKVLTRTQSPTVNGCVERICRPDARFLRMSLAASPAMTTKSSSASVTPPNAMTSPSARTP